MRVVRRHLGMLFMLGLCTPLLWAQTNAGAGPPAKPEAKPNPWEYNLSVSGYIVPHQEGYVSPTLTADRDWVHFEARYNYEAQRTGSLWAGYNFHAGKTVQLEATPMVGGVFGQVNGGAPGLEFTVTYKKLQFFSANEYIFDTDTKAGNFFYTWTQLTYSPVKGFMAGYVVQRTRAYQTPLDVQRGPLVGFSHKKMQFSTQFFNIGETDPTINLSVGYSF